MHSPAQTATVSPRLSAPKNQPPLLTAAARKGWRSVRKLYRTWFQNKNFVFVHRGPFEPFEAKTCRISRYERYEDIPTTARACMEGRGRPRAIEGDKRELAQGSVMWIAYVGDQPAASLFGRRGSRFQNWFVHLEPEDVVLFRGSTYAEFRGKGIMPALIRTAMHDLLADGGAAYCDCKVYNAPSKKCIEKAGFKQIAIMRSISRETAVGQ